MLRAFHEGVLPGARDELVLGREESRHLARVRRARSGETVQVLDGCGGVLSGVLVNTGSDNARVRCVDIERHPRSPTLELAVGLPKGGVIEDIICQATELGATAIQPLLTAHTESRPDASKFKNKLARWHAVAVEACKQSGNPWLLDTRAPVELPVWLKSLAGVSQTAKFVAALTPDAIPLSEIETRSSKLGTPLRIIAVGPEGDFSPEEYAQFRKFGFTSVRLPGHVLRVETACAAALVLLCG